MSYEVVASTLRVYTADDRARLFATLLDMGQEWVRASRWPEYETLMAAYATDYGEATAAAEMEEMLAEVSFVTKPYLVENNFRKYRQWLHKLAQELELNVENI